MIKERWLELSIREKQMVSVGSFCLLVFLLYYFAWSPFSSKVENLKTQVKQNEMLLTWMQETDQKMQGFQKNNRSGFEKPHGSPLSILQNAIQQSEIAKNLSDMQQKERDAIQLSFKEVNFDQLMTWLIQHSSDGWTVSEFTVTKTSNPGMVSAVFQLRF